MSNISEAGRPTSVTAVKIESKQAGQLLYSLQQAATNVIASGATLDGLSNLDDEYSDGVPLRAYPSLEEDFDLPEGLDLTPDLDDNLLEDEQADTQGVPHRPNSQNGKM